jgi:hypothetical protein
MRQTLIEKPLTPNRRAKILKNGRANAHLKDLKEPEGNELWENDFGKFCIIDAHLNSFMASA